MIIHNIVEGNVFCCYCREALSTEEIIERHIKNYFKINGKQRIKMLKKGEYVGFKNYK